MTLGELREQFGVPRADVARRLQMAEGAVASLEAVSVNDASGNTLSLYVQALGGRLEAVVTEPGGVERRVSLFNIADHPTCGDCGMPLAQFKDPDGSQGWTCVRCSAVDS